MFKLIRDHKIVTAALVVGLVGSFTSLAVMNQPEEVTKPKESVEMSVKEEQIIEPKEEVVETIEMEAPEPVATPEIKAKVKQVDIEQEEAGLPLEEPEQTEKLYGTDLGSKGCKENQVYRSYMRKYATEEEWQALANTKTNNIMMINGNDGRMHCTSNF